MTALDTDTPPRRGSRSPWAVLIIAIVTAGMSGPGQTSGVAVFIDPIVDDLGVSRTSVSAAYMVGTLVGGALLPTVGHFVDRRGVRLAQIILGLAFGVALASMSVVTGLAALALGFAGVRFLGQGSLLLVATVTVQRGFDRSRGAALGVFTTSSSALIALAPLALALLVNAFGWRPAFLLTACVVSSVVVACAAFGLRDRSTPAPHDPVAGSIAPGPGPPTVPAIHSFTRIEAMATPPFWLLAAMTAAGGMMGSALHFHQMDLLGDAGIPRTTAAALFVPQVIGATVAGLLIGYLSDRLGTKYLPAATMLLLLAALLSMSVVGPGPVAIVYSLALGAAIGAIRTAGATIQPRWFGLEHVGSIQGAIVLFGIAASAIGPVVLTLAEQTLGSYSRAAMALCVVPLSVLGFALGPNDGPDLRVDER